jgi:hypothetical protein
MPGLSRAAKFPIRSCKKDVQSSTEATRGWGVTSVRRRDGGIGTRSCQLPLACPLALQQNRTAVLLSTRTRLGVSARGAKFLGIPSALTATPCGARLNHRDTWNGCLSEENLRRHSG